MPETDEPILEAPQQRADVTFALLKHRSDLAGAYLRLGIMSGICGLALGEALLDEGIWSTKIALVLVALPCGALALSLFGNLLSYLIEGCEAAFAELGLNFLTLNLFENLHPSDFKEHPVKSFSMIGLNLIVLGSLVLLMFSIVVAAAYALPKMVGSETSIVEEIFSKFLSIKP